MTMHAWEKEEGEFPSHFPFHSKASSCLCTSPALSPASSARTWMYRKAPLRTLRFEVFLSSTLGMLRFNVSKHSFKCARLKKTQVGRQLTGHTPETNSTRGESLIGALIQQSTYTCAQQPPSTAGSQLSQLTQAEIVPGFCPSFVRKTGQPEMK